MDKSIKRSVQKDFLEVIQTLKQLNQIAENILHSVKKEQDLPPPLPQEVVLSEINNQISVLYDKVLFVESFFRGINCNDPKTRIAEELDKLCDLLKDLR